MMPNTALESDAIRRCASHARLNANVRPRSFEGREACADVNLDGLTLWRTEMQYKVPMLATAAISALLGAAISTGISNSEAQPPGPKQFQFALTGTSEGTPKMKRYEDLEYGIVCYMGGMTFGCAKK